MKLLTTKKERAVVMEQLRPVSKREKIIFPIVVTIFVALLLPSAAPLIGMLMLGNLFRECGVTERLSKTAQNELMQHRHHLPRPLRGRHRQRQTPSSTGRRSKILLLGVCAFCFGTVGGVLLGKLMYKLTGGKVNPLIGSAGVSAVPMAARVSQEVGAGRKSRQLPADARHGPERCGRNRLARLRRAYLLALFGNRNS